MYREWKEIILYFANAFQNFNLIVCTVEPWLSWHWLFNQPVIRIRFGFYNFYHNFICDCETQKMFKMFKIHKRYMVNRNIGFSGNDKNKLNRCSK